MLLNIMGGQQKFSPLDHILLNNNPTYYISSENKVNESEIKNFNQIINYIAVTSYNDDWILKEAKDEKNPIYLKDYIVTNSLKKVALFVDSRIHLGALVKILIDAGLNEEVIIFANEQKIIIELKKMAPRWLFAANPSQKMRIKIMDSIWLSSISNYDFDFYIFDPEKELELSPQLVKELKKRHKKILIKASPSSLEKQSSFDGLFLI
ncbi:MAG: hypothetical protein H6625_05205 [Bdellovibrionaceae bacterium]|nr:hypothetical protein [Pseudobdellovibrionaceae bacterium]